MRDHDKMNPKEGRVPLHLLPAAGRIAGAMACRQGAIDYGEYNWREKPISLMEYTGAIERHLLAVRDGQDIDAKSLEEHFGHIIATASIILDARECGTLIDDRVGDGPAARLLDEAAQRIKDREAPDHEKRR